MAAADKRPGSNDDPCLGAEGSASAGQLAGASSSQAAAVGSRLYGQNSKKSWLLRLFQSQFFDPYVAISYLWKYQDDIGVQDYLCGRFAQFSMEEIEFLLPQLCHLYLQRPMVSNAIEAFLLDLCVKSSHIAIFLLWYLEAYLADLSSNPESPSFYACSRLFGKCQAIVFSDTRTHDEGTIQEQATPGQGAGAQPAIIYSHRTQPLTCANVAPALMGIGAMLGAMAPIALAPARRMALSEGRAFFPEFYTGAGGAAGAARRASSSGGSHAIGHKLLRRQTSASSTNGTAAYGAAYRGNRRPQATRDIASTPSPTTETPETRAAVSDHHQGDVNEDKRPSRGDRHRGDAGGKVNVAARSNSASISASHHQRVLSARIPARSPSLEDMYRGDAFSLKHYIQKAGSNSPLPTASRTSKRETPTLSTSMPSNPDATSDEGSTGAGKDASSSQRHGGSTTEATVEARGAKHDMPADRSLNAPSTTVTEAIGVETKRLLSSHYFHSEMQFITSLIDISDRLCHVPNTAGARPQALQAELSLLNHNLPACVCLPIWCQFDRTGRHHRVVRVSPKDAVTLNSAERVPYLVLVEVLEGDEEYTIDDLVEMKRHALTGNNSNQGTNDDLNAVSGMKTHNPSDSDGEIESIATITPAPRKIGSDNVAKEGSCDMDGNPSKTSINSLPESDTSRSREAMDAGEKKASDAFYDQMRSAAIMLAQLNPSNISTVSAPKPGDATASANKPATTAKTLLNPAMANEIRARIVKEMKALEERRLQTLASVHGPTAASSLSNAMVQKANKDWAVGDDDQMEADRIADLKLEAEDPSAAVFMEKFEDKKERIRASSPYGHLPTWNLYSMIVKTGADCRQEQLALQLIHVMQQIWDEEDIDLWVYYYRIMVIADDSGFIETIKNSMSVHSIKKHAYVTQMNQPGLAYSLFDHYTHTFGKPDTPGFKKAQDNFLKSLAAYSLVTYLLQLRDRHNGNVLVDTEGHIIHIDFGFILSNSPGSVGFELAPFKLPNEYVAILGGMESDAFRRFRNRLCQGFLALRKHHEKLITLVAIMQKNSKLPCFMGGESVVPNLKARFHLNLTESQVRDHLDHLITSSYANVFTRLYDSFQYYSNGVL